MCAQDPECTKRLVSYCMITVHPSLRDTEKETECSHNPLHLRPAPLVVPPPQIPTADPPLSTYVEQVRAAQRRAASWHLAAWPPNGCQSAELTDAPHHGHSRWGGPERVAQRVRCIAGPSYIRTTALPPRPVAPWPNLHAACRQRWRLVAPAGARRRSVLRGVPFWRRGTTEAVSDPAVRSCRTDCPPALPGDAFSRVFKLMHFYWLIERIWWFTPDSSAPACGASSGPCTQSRPPSPAAPLPH